METGDYIPKIELPRLLADLEANLDPKVYAEVLRIIEKHLWLSVGVRYTSECL